MIVDEQSKEPAVLAYGQSESNLGYYGILGRAFERTGSYTSLPISFVIGLSNAAALNLVLPRYPDLLGTELAPLDLSLIHISEPTRP